ncbi:MAG: glycosyltransferase family 2 protein [Candidatus Omnitrophica bacterium]|nr:glycosyltransferase family 2 protein [Candidatus Omnitrophota bacterium]
MKKLDVGLVIFTKNEEKTIGWLIDRVCNWIDKKDVFVVDGHSTDETALIVERKDICLFFDSKKGKGSAVQLALDKIEKDILVFMDSDGSHSPEEIPLLLEPFLIYKDVAMVVGSRFKGGSEEFHGSFHEVVRFIGNVVGTFLINLIWRAKLTDVQNGFRAVKRDIIRNLSLTENSFAIEQEMVMKCLKNKKKIVEVPSWELKRRYSNSHLIPSRMLPRFIVSFIKNIFF